MGKAQHTRQAYLEARRKYHQAAAALGQLVQKSEEIAALEHDMLVLGQAKEQIGRSEALFRSQKEVLQDAVKEDYINYAKCVLENGPELEQLPEYDETKGLDAWNAELRDYVRKSAKLHPDVPDVDKMLKDYEACKENPFIRELLKDTEKEGKNLLDRLHDARQKMQEEEEAYIQKVTDRGYPSSVKDIITQKWEYDKLAPEVKNEIKQEDVDQLLKTRLEYKDARKEHDSYTNSLNAGQKEKQLRNQHYIRLTNDKQYKELDSPLKEELTRKLDAQLALKPVGELKSLAEFYQEEAGLQQLSDEIEAQKKSEIAMMPQNFTDIYKLDSGKRAEVDALIDNLIAKHPGEKAVESVQDYYKSLEEEKKIADTLEVGKIKRNIADIRQLRTVDNGRVSYQIASAGSDLLRQELQNKLEDYIKKEAAAFEVKIPATPKEWSRIKEQDARQYDIMAEKVNEILTTAEYQWEDQTISVGSLQDYAALEQELAELKVQKDKAGEAYKKEHTIENSDELAKLEREYSLKELAHAEITEKITKQIADYNKQNQSKAPAAERELEAAKAELYKAVDNYNEKVDKVQAISQKENIAALEKLREKNEQMKRFIKDEVIKAEKKANEQKIKEAEGKLSAAKKAHQEHKKAIDTMLKAGVEDTAFLAAEQEKINQLKNAMDQKKEIYKNQKKAMAKAIKTAGTKLTENKRKAYENYDRIYEGQRRRDNQIIKEHTEALKKIVRDEKKENKSRRQVTEQRLKNYRMAELRKAQSERGLHCVKKHAVSTVNSLMSKLHSGFRDIVLGAEIAQVQGVLDGKIQMLERKENQRVQLNRSLGDPDIQLPVLDIQKSREALEKLSKEVDKDSPLNQRIQELERELVERKKGVEKALQPENQQDRGLKTEVNEAVVGALQKAAGDDPVKRSEADIRQQISDTELENVLAQDQTLKEEFQKNNEFVEQIGTMIAPIFNEQNNFKVQLVLVTMEKATNMIIGKINTLQGAAGSNALKKINFTQSIQNFNKRMQDADTKEPDPAFQDQCVEALQHVFKKFSECVEMIEGMNLDFSVDFMISSQNAQRLELDEERYQAFKEKHKEEFDNKYDLRMAFEQENNNNKIAVAEKKAALYHDAGTEVDAVLAAKRELTEQKKEQISAEIQREPESMRAELKQEMDQSFAAAVKAGADKDEVNRPCECSTDMLEVDPLAFLEKITQTSITQEGQEPDFNAAFDAACQVYVNGISAVAVFNLEEGYQKALAGKAEEQHAFMDQVKDFGKEMQRGINARISGEASTSPCASAVLSVENENMLLSAVAVQLTDADLNGKTEDEKAAYRERINQFNRSMKSGNADLNESRVAAAKKLQQRQKNAHKEKDKTITALHKSRDLSFARA